MKAKEECEEMRLIYVQAVSSNHAFPLLLTFKKRMSRRTPFSPY